MDFSYFNSPYFIPPVETFRPPAVGSYMWWWLRSPGYYYDGAAFVNGLGGLVYFAGVDSPNGGVRPALWLLDTPQAEH